MLVDANWDCDQLYRESRRTELGQPKIFYRISADNVRSTGTSTCIYDTNENEIQKTNAPLRISEGCIWVVQESSVEQDV